jgi:hypothetical protein
MISDSKQHENPLDAADVVVVDEAMKNAEIRNTTEEWKCSKWINVFGSILAICFLVFSSYLFR